MILLIFQSILVNLNVLSLSMCYNSKKKKIKLEKRGKFLFFSVFSLLFPFLASFRYFVVLSFFLNTKRKTNKQKNHCFPFFFRLIVDPLFILKQKTSFSSIPITEKKERTEETRKGRRNEEKKKEKWRKLFRKQFESKR